jgi:glycosyltransferase involved in cell wall biosynthesis
MPSFNSPTVSIVVPVYNGGEHFHRCLNSLSHAAPPPDEIIVVADGESDGCWRLAESFAARVIGLPVTGGPARARNQGARAATGDILLFIDSDVAVPSDIVRKVTDIFTHDADLTAVIGSYDDEPAATNFLSQYKNLLHHYVHQNACEEGFTFWGACGAIRREIFFALEGFDESYREPSIEDIELGYRLKRAGHKIRLAKEIQVTHLKRWGALSLLKSDFVHRALPWTELALRDRHLPDDLNLRRSSRLSALLACGFTTSLLAAFWSRKALGIATLLALSLLTINASLYLFFYRKRGAKFTLGAIPWHWFYFLYGTLAFSVGTLRFLVNRCVSRAFNSMKAISTAGKS